MRTIDFVVECKIEQTETHSFDLTDKEVAVLDDAHGNDIEAVYAALLERNKPFKRTVDKWDFDTRKVTMLVTEMGCIGIEGVELYDE